MIWFLVVTINPGEWYSTHPVLWCLHCPCTSRTCLCPLWTCKAPSPIWISNWGVVSYNWNMRCNALISTNAMFWEWKASTSTSSAPAYLLRLFGLHQHHHCYVPKFDYLLGSSNMVTDSLSSDFSMFWPDLCSSLSTLLTQSTNF